MTVPQPREGEKTMTELDPALLTLLTNFSQQLERVANSQDALRKDVHAEVASLRTDLVPREEHRQALANMGRSIDSVREAVTKESTQREKDVARLESESKAELTRVDTEFARALAPIASKVEQHDKFRWILVGALAAGAASGSGLVTLLVRA